MLCALAAFGLLLFTHVVFAEQITIGGGGAALDGIIKPVKDPFEKATGIKIEFRYSTDIVSFKQLQEGTLDASTFGGTYDDFRKVVDNVGAKTANPADFTPIQIGKARIYTIINKSNPVNSLTKEQLKGIFTGKVSNWKNVGGNDAEILVVLSTMNKATNSFFQTAVLDGESFLKDIMDAGTFKDIGEKVASVPDTIAFGPLPLLNGTIKSVETPIYSRPISILTKGKPSPKVRKLIDFITAEGSKYIKE